MADFESGISAYIHTRAVVDVFFPVDKRGVADISCSQCYYYREMSKRCGLNSEVCQYPNRYVGGSCPLEAVIEEENQNHE